MRITLNNIGIAFTLILNAQLRQKIKVPHRFCYQTFLEPKSAHCDECRVCGDCVHTDRLKLVDGPLPKSEKYNILLFHQMFSVLFENISQFLIELMVLHFSHAKTITTMIVIVIIILTVQQKLSHPM